MANKKILVVDDEDEILELLDRKLSLSGYQVIKASRGRQAIAKAKTFLPSLILMDIMMPDIDGSEAVTLLKSDPETQNIPIIFLSGIVKQEDEGAGISTVKVGNNQYPAIAKPFAFDELLEAIETAIKKQKTV